MQGMLNFSAPSLDSYIF